MNSKIKSENRTIVVNDSNKAEYETMLPEITAQETGNVTVFGKNPVILIDEAERV